MAPHRHVQGSGLGIVVARDDLPEDDLVCRRRRSSKASFRRDLSRLICRDDQESQDSES